MDLGASINKLADSVISASGPATILDNPFYSAIFIVIIIVLILHIEGFRANSGYTRAMLYAIVATAAFLFVYHRRYTRMHAINTRIDTIGNALSRITAVDHPDAVPIIPFVYASDPTM